MISVVIPIYNGERFLRLCLDSILSQSLRELEVLCVNDGSKDSTQTILEEYAAKDPRVQIIRQKNQGVAAARNNGMDRAKGEYLWFFDGDDVMQPGAAEAMLRRAEETGADFVVGNFQYYHQSCGLIQTPSGRVTERVWTGEDRLKITHYAALCGCKLWRTAFLREHDLRFWPFRLGEDVAFYLCAAASSTTIASLDRNIYYYRMYDGSSCRSYSMKTLERIELFDWLENFYRKHPEMENFRKEMMLDRMFHYNLALARLPSHVGKQERRQIVDAYIKAEKRLDFSEVQNRADIMEQVKRFDHYVKFRWLYESNLYAVLYRAGRRVKHLLKKLCYANRKIEL